MAGGDKKASRHFFAPADKNSCRGEAEAAEVKITSG